MIAPGEIRRVAVETAGLRDTFTLATPFRRIAIYTDNDTKGIDISLRGAAEALGFGGPRSSSRTKEGGSTRGKTIEALSIALTDGSGRGWWGRARPISHR